MVFQREDTFEKVRNIIAEKLGMPVETITATSTFKDLGADSLDLVDMIMAFEEVFGIEIKDEEAEKIQTVENAVAHIHAVRTK